jgi:glutamate--cysteine ligase
MLVEADGERPLRDWGRSLLKAMLPVAKQLDAAHQSLDYSAALNTMQLRLSDAAYTPAATMLREMAENGETYYRMAMRKACEQREHFCARPLSPETLVKYVQLAEQSIERQAEVEAADSLSFDEFLAQY